MGIMHITRLSQCLAWGSQFALNPVREEGYHLAVDSATSHLVLWLRKSSK